MFKYSPSFALMMAPFYALPDWLGLFLWNLLNALVLFLAIKKLPGFSELQKVLVLLFCLIELITSMQNAQSNALMAGLLILAFTSFESGKPIWAVMLILISAFIKIFGLAGFLLCLFYPQKPKMVMWGSIFAVLFFLLPVPVVGFQQLIWQYQNWGVMLANDHAASVGLSVQGILTSWFGLTQTKGIVLLTGLAGLLIPYLYLKKYAIFDFRLLSLASLLVWLVIFNHKAESPTFIIALVGVALWYFYSDRTALHTTLAVLVFVFTSLAVTDISPSFFRNTYVYAYSIKALPCILVWCLLVWELITLRKTKIKSDIP